MKPKSHHILCAAVFMIFLTGCATYQAQKVGSTPIMRAEEEIPEDQLMDVGIVVFESKELSEKQAEDQGTNNEIRQAENHFIPYHLKATLQQTSHWGAIQVIPAETNSVDLFVKGEILESNGETLALRVKVVDASGKTWFTKNYKAEAVSRTYSGNRVGEKDAFQDIYNAIANDMAEFKQKLSPEQIAKIRTISKLKFAQDFAPDAFEGYLAKDKKDKITIKRLPAVDDPTMKRLLKIREREYMYVDTLNEQYDGFYNVMWPSYENWRQLNMTERIAMKKIKREALIRQLAGALIIAGGIASASTKKGGPNVGALEVGLILIGGQVIISGFNVSKEAEIHEAAIEELSESFSSEMKPVVLEFEGKQYELTGSAKEQFKTWRELLRQIYYAETGFEPDPIPQRNGSDSSDKP